MGKLNVLLATTKAKVITGVVVVAVAGGAGGGTIYYNHVQETKAEAAAEQKKKKDAAELKEIKNAYDDFLAWKDRLILSEEENMDITAKLEKLKGYIDSGKNTKEAPDLLAGLDEQLSAIEEANKTLLADTSKELLEANTSSYLEEDKTSYEGMKETYQTAFAEGRYKDAYAYLDEMRAFTETALAKAEAATKETETASSDKNTGKNIGSTKNSSNKSSGSNGSTSFASSGENQQTTTEFTSSGKTYSDVEDHNARALGFASAADLDAKRAQAKAMANATGQPVNIYDLIGGLGCSESYEYPDGWTVEQMMEWDENYAINRAR